MPALITNGTKTLTPFSLSGYTSTQEGGSLIHDILGRRDPDVTLRPLRMRAGSMVLDFSTEATSAAAREALSATSSWSLAHSERASINMRFIVRQVSRVVESDGRWGITVEWEEVP